MKGCYSLNVLTDNAMQQHDATRKRTIRSLDWLSESRWPKQPPKKLSDVDQNRHLHCRLLSPKIRRLRSSAIFVEPFYHQKRHLDDVKLRLKRHLENKVKQPNAILMMLS